MATPSVMQNHDSLSLKGLGKSLADQVMKMDEDAEERWKELMEKLKGVEEIIERWERQKEFNEWLQKELEEHAAAMSYLSA